MTEQKILQDKIKTMLSKQGIECPKCNKKLFTYNERQIVQCDRCFVQIGVYKTAIDNSLFGMIDKDSDLLRLNRVFREMEKIRLMHQNEKEEFIDFFYKEG